MNNRDFNEILQLLFPTLQLIPKKNKKRNTINSKKTILQQLIEEERKRGRI